MGQEFACCGANIRRDHTEQNVEAIKRQTEAHYSDLVKQGYSFLTNVGDNKAEEYAKKNRERGLDVVIGDIAFMVVPGSKPMRTIEYPGCKVLLARKKSN